MKAVGTSAVRAGGRARVTGEQQFLADIRLEDVLDVKLVTLDCARARIDSIDTRAALGIPGVVDVLIAADLPDPMPRFGPVYQDRPVLAVGETRYHGEPVAAVIATSRDAAEQGVKAVRVDHTVLPAVLGIDAALAPDAPIVHPAEDRDGVIPGSNVLQVRDFGWGDVDAAEADVVIDKTYTFPMITHFAIEPHGAIVAAEPDRMRVWSPVQHPYLLQRTMAELFDLPLAKIRVFAPDPGGAFGGKQNPKFEPLLAWCSIKSRRPCRLVLTLEETFQAVRRAAARIRVRSGFTNDGTLAFHDIASDFLIGAYVDISERVMTKSNYLACGPYRVPNARIHARAIQSHTTPSTAFRGFGTPQVNWAVESQLDHAARLLGMDGLQIRRLNLAKHGEQFVPGDVPADGHWDQAVRKAAEAIGWDRPRTSGRGVGIACGIKSGATTGLSQSTVRLLFDASVIVLAGTSDMGQGARTIFAQIAADELGVPVNSVSVVSGDTDLVPFDLQTSASRSTVFMGNAIQRACEDIRNQLLDMARQLHPGHEVSWSSGHINVDGEPQPISEVLRNGLGRLRGEVIGNGTYRKADMPAHPLGGDPAFYEFNCTAFEVEVDTETGEILIHNHVTVSDVGRAINPLQVESQDEGAAIMGLGHSMMEHVLLDAQGRIRNLGALDYRIPTTKDLPLHLQTAVIENGDGPGPYGSKGVSEGGLLCTAPALAAAVADATGCVIEDLPLTPERVWKALHSTEHASPTAMRIPASDGPASERVHID